VSAAGQRDASRAAEPDYPEVGERLRARRRERHLSLRDLAERLGVSPSLISQIERGRAKPSVSTLYALVAELDVSLDELLFNDEWPPGQPAAPAAAVASGRVAPDAPAQGDGASGAPVTTRAQPVQPAGSRHRIRLASGVIWERLTTVSEPGVEFLYVVYEVGGASSPADAFQRHAGHEWGYVISGTLEVVIGFERHVLEAGDAVSLDSRIPHRLVNIGDTPVHAIWFVMGRDVDPRLIDQLPGS
jgi:transcriptional regulator with XRE-family HTH domain/mannose-6-phosphate isomerase-like protein (cupin superfamily)